MPNIEGDTMLVDRAMDHCRVHHIKKSSKTTYCASLGRDRQLHLPWHFSNIQSEIKLRDEKGHVPHSLRSSGH